MNIAIIFYSFSGNTKKACDFIHQNITASGGKAEEIEIKLKTDNRSFVKQCWQAARKQAPQILNSVCPVENYDFLVFASPVWAYTMAPGLRTYLNNIDSLSGKKVAWVFTYGGGAGSAIKEAEEFIRNKKGNLLFSKAIHGNKTTSQEYLRHELASLLEMLEGPR